MSTTEKGGGAYFQEDMVLIILEILVGIKFGD